MKYIQRNRLSIGYPSIILNNFNSLGLFGFASIDQCLGPCSLYEWKYLGIVNKEALG